MRTPLRVAAGTAAVITVVAGLGVATASAATPTTAVSGNVPSFATAAHRNGTVSTSAKLTISVYLTPRNEGALTAFARDVSTPGTSSYHHFLTPSQFHAQFSPAASDVSAVKDFLTGAGLTVTAVAGNNGYVDATGTVAQVEKALQVTQSTYSVQGQSVRANAEAPQLPAALAGKVYFVGGLDSVQDLLTPAAAPPTPTAPALPCSNVVGTQMAHVDPAIRGPYGADIPFPLCGLTPQEIRALYGLPATYTPGQGYTGHGVRVGVVDAFASPYQPADLNRFSAKYGLPNGSDLDFTSIVAPGTYNEPVNKKHNPASWYGEEALDLVAVHSIAPEASIVYAGSPNNQMPLDHALEALIDAHRVDVVTNSWGFNGEPAAPGYFKAEEVAFMQAAAEGISVTFSSGDDGDVGALTGLAQASWPASSDFVTAVGGTSVLPDGQGGKQQYGWGTYFSNLSKPTIDGGSAPDMSVTTHTITHDPTHEAWPPAFLFGAGGGASQHVLQPWYQQHRVGTLGDSAALYDANGPAGQSVTYSQSRRVVPDVAMDADPYTGLLMGETFTKSSFAPSNYNQDNTPCTQTGGSTEYCETAIGGTSLASPLFAGVLALVDQSRLDAGKAPVGFVNPVLYDGTAGAGISDVLPPAGAPGFIRTRQAPSALSARFVTVNSTVDAGGNLVEGADTTLRTTQGYDDVTGLGAPVLPALVSALG